MKLRLLLLVFAVAVAGMGGMLLLRSSGAPSERPDSRALRTAARAPTPAEREALQREAVKACRCARKLPPGNSGRDACWTAFNRQVARFPHSERGTLCGPMSTEEICFDGNCIFKSYGDDACSRDEARVLQVIVDEDLISNPQRFERRMNRAVQSFIRGERVEAPRSSGGCAG